MSYRFSRVQMFNKLNFIVIYFLIDYEDSDNINSKYNSQFLHFENVF